MNIWPGIFSLLNSKSAITDVIGSSPMRFYPNILPQGISTFPAISYRTVVIIGNPNFDGASQLDFNQVDFHVFANTHAGAESLVSLLRTELEDTKGVFNGLNIQNVRYIDSGSDDYLDNIEKYTKSIEFRFSTLR